MSEPVHLTDVREAYDTVAEDYARLLPGVGAETPLDLALLATFAELVRESGLGPVADVGCGPGRMTAHLTSMGVAAFGVDLSPGMVRVARRSHPGLDFRVGSMARLDLADGALGGVLAWYSLIHTPPEELAPVLREFARVLAPGGHVLAAFQAGEGRRTISRAYGQPVSFEAHLLPPDRLGDLMAAAGLEVHTRLLRGPQGREKWPQACLLARKAG